MKHLDKKIQYETSRLLALSAIRGVTGRYMRSRTVGFALETESARDMPGRFVKNGSHKTTLTKENKQ